MAAISVTVASVVGSTDSNDYESGISGETIAAGQALCLNPTTNKIELADANGASAYMKTVIGISQHGSLLNQPIRYQRRSNMTFNAALTQGTIYVLSATPGGIAPASDLASGHTVVILGVASSTTVLAMSINNTGIAV